MAKTTFKIKVEMPNGQNVNYGTDQQSINGDVSNLGNQNVATTKSAQTSKTSKAIGVALLSSGKSVLKYGVSAYGDFTGDYVAQNSINRGLDVVNVGIETAGYVALLGPAGFAIEGLKLGTEGIIKIAQNYVAVRNQKINNSIQTERRGNLLSKGGR